MTAKVGFDGADRSLIKADVSEVVGGDGRLCAAFD